MISHELIGFWGVLEFRTLKFESTDITTIFLLNFIPWLLGFVPILDSRDREVI